MSYILDALRKSEHERQMAAGLNASLLYPIEMKRRHNSWLILTLLLLVALIVAALIWWLRPAPLPATMNQPAVAPKPRVIPEQPPIISGRPPTPPEKILKKPEPQAEKLLAEHVQKESVLRTRIQANPKNLQEPQPHAPSIPGMPPSTSQQTGADPLLGMPALQITGYLQNEQGASVAMINNRLVHEGEEISPGLRLVKILDGSAIFSYKGYIFSR